VVPQDLGGELARERGVAHDVERESQQPRHLVRRVALVVQELED
jgi:hypothetical protein